MSTYQRLPPISRTPSPPAHILRRLQAFGGTLTPIGEACSTATPTTAAPSSPLSSPSSASSATATAAVDAAVDAAADAAAAPTPTPKKKKPKKRFLLLGKDSTGKWKRRRKEQEDREIQKALSSIDPDPNADADADDMLESIHVAGGFLMIGNGSANPPLPPPPPPRKRKRPSAAARPTPKPLLINTAVSQFATTSTTSSSLSEPDENENDDELFAALTSPTSPGSKISPATTLPAEPPPTPTIFHVYRFPELTPTLSTHAPSFGDRVLLDWTQLLTSTELDRAVAGGGTYELAISDPALPERERVRWWARVKEQKDGCRKRGYEELDDAFLTPSASRWRSGAGELGVDITVSNRDQVVDVEERTMRVVEIEEKTAETEVEDIAVGIKYTAAQAEPEDSRVEMKDTAMQADPKDERMDDVRAEPDPPPKKNVRPASAEPAIGGKITLAEALQRQREQQNLQQRRVRCASEGEQHEKGKEKGKEKNNVKLAFSEAGTNFVGQKAALRGMSAPAPFVGTVACSEAPFLHFFPLLSLPEAEVPSPPSETLPLSENLPSSEKFPIPTEPTPVEAPAPSCELPQSLPQPLELESQPIVPPSNELSHPPSKEPSHDDHPKATVAGDDSSVEDRIGDCQRAAQSGDNVLQATAECTPGDPTHAPQQMDVADIAASPVPESADKESALPHTPRSVSMSPSASTEISTHLRQRSAETVEAAVTLNAVAAEAAEAARTHTSEEDGQSHSVDIMHGADLLLWAAGAVDPDFTPHMSTPGMSTQSQYEMAQATVTAVTAVAAVSPKKQKPRKPKEPKVKTVRKKSLIVVLKVPSTDPPSVNGEPSGTDSTPVTPSPCTLNWSTQSPKLPPVNIPIPIPRPQPYRKPELDPLKTVPWTSTMDALAAVRKGTEQVRFAKANAVRGNTNFLSSPKGEVNSPNPTTSSHVFPRPAYAKPIPMDGSPSSGGTWGASGDRSPTIPFTRHFPAYPVAGNFFNRNETVNGAGNSLPPSGNNTAGDEIATDVGAGDAARTSPSFSAVPRVTLTPEYIEVKKIAPLVSKSNFLYWEPSMSADVKPLIAENSGRTPADALPGFANGFGLGLLSQSRSLSDTVRSTTAPPLQSRPPLRSPPLFQSQQQPQPSPQPQPQPSPQPQPQPQQPTASTSVPQRRPVDPSDMIFNISRYQKPDQTMILHGKDLLCDSSLQKRKVFSWRKLVARLEAGLQFDDFRESLIVNHHHMVEDQAELNEGLEWFKRENEVVVTKVNGLGKPPAELVAKMKKTRKELRPAW